MKPYSIELPRNEWELFRVILKVQDIPYEPSECGDLVHVEIMCTEKDAIALEASLNVIRVAMAAEETKKY